MRHFIAYHNAKDMGYSCIDIPEPRVRTGNDVEGLEGVTVWLVAGEGEAPKSYFLASKFVATRCETNFFPAPKRRNLIAGDGELFARRIPLDDTGLIELIRKESANFVRGLYETHNPTIVSALKALA